MSLTLSLRLKTHTHTRTERKADKRKGGRGREGYTADGDCSHAANDRLCKTLEINYNGNYRTEQTRWVHVQLCDQSFRLTQLLLLATCCISMLLPTAMLISCATATLSQAGVVFQQAHWKTLSGVLIELFARCYG